jgi:endo-1,4-beta-xylanase
VTFRRTLLLGAASVVGACSLLLAPAVAIAAPSSNAVGTHTDSLRDLGARVGLRVGTAVNPTELSSARYSSLIADQFSTVTPENEMKWETVEPTRGHYNWAPADRLVAFAKANHQLVRGHTLVWHNQLPSWLTTGVANGSIGKDELRAILKKHITDEVSHFKGKIWQWDVVNEAFHDTWEEDGDPSPSRFWVNHLGAGILADAFRWAHAADPKALLFYNDYAIEDVNTKSTNILSWMKGLKAQGVPIDGIGFQTHLDTQYGVPGDFTQDMQRFADAGFKVAVTEADVRTDVVPGTNTPTAGHGHTADENQKLQEANWKQTIDSCLAVRACISYTVWGVSDDQSWVPSTFPGEGAALLYDANLQPKPQYFVVQHELATTDAAHRTGEGAGRA